VTEVSAARPQLARRLNLSNVLGLFWSSEVLTVSDIMRATGLTRATVHAACNDLVRLGWIRELEARREAGAQAGRPSRRFALHRRAGYVLGVDMAERSINVLLADLSGTAVSRKRAGLSPVVSAAERVELIGTLVGDVLERASITPAHVLAAGVGVAMPVRKDGTPMIRAHPDAYTSSFHIDADRLREVLGGVCVHIANDANLAALAERRVGAAQGVDDVVTLLLTGERMGAGLMESGRLLYGHLGAAGELYFLDETLGFGASGGITGLARERAGDAMRAGRSTLLEQWTGDGDRLTAEHVFEAAAHGDEVAAEALEHACERLARVISVLSTFLDPELVVISGAFAASARVLLEPITRHLRDWTYSPPRVTCSTLGEANVTVGAVRLALDHVQQRALDLTLPRQHPSAGSGQPSAPLA
jgi:predicted NBD/HSP70 family sugar kinase